MRRAELLSGQRLALAWPALAREGRARSLLLEAKALRELARDVDVKLDQLAQPRLFGDGKVGTDLAEQVAVGMREIRLAFDSHHRPLAGIVDPQLEGVGIASWTPGDLRHDAPV